MSSRSARAAGATAVALALAAAAPALRFESVFAAAGEPPLLHYHAAYLAGGTTHFVEVWRDGDKRLKRVTDGRITMIATHKPGDPEFRLTVIDPVKRVITTIDRTNLYRLGNFTDWFDLGHGLRHPKSSYGLVAGAPPRSSAAPISACRWFDLSAATRTTHVCWSRNIKLPLVIVSADGILVWRITAVERVVPADTFRIADHGFVRVDANRDLDHD